MDFNALTQKLLLEYTTFESKKKKLTKPRTKFATKKYKKKKFETTTQDKAKFETPKSKFEWHKKYKRRRKL